MFNSRKRLGVLFSFISLLLLGFMPIISNSRPLHISALNFALYLSIWQLIFSTPVLLIELRSNNKGIFAADLSDRLKRKTAIIILITGAMFGISTFAYVLSMEKAGSVGAAIALQAYPLFAIILEAAFLKKKKRLNELFFTMILIIGLFYLVTQGTWQIDELSIWFGLALCVPLIWSIAHISLREVLNRTPITPVQVTFFRVLISSIIIFSISFTVHGLDEIINPLRNSTFQVFASLMGLVYYLELISWFYAVRHIDVSLASSITTPWPIITMVLATIFLHDSIESYQIIAMLLVIMSVYGILYSGRRNSRLIITNN